MTPFIFQCLEVLSKGLCLWLYKCKVRFSPAPPAFYVFSSQGFLYQLPRLAGRDSWGWLQHVISKGAGGFLPQGRQLASEIPLTGPMKPNKQDTQGTIVLKQLYHGLPQPLTPTQLALPILAKSPGRTPETLVILSLVPSSHKTVSH